MSGDATPTRESFRLFHRLRVRWAEVDMQRIVFNAHYLMYFDTALAEYWRAMALPYEDAMAALGGDLYVRKATLDFRASARLDDRVDVALRCARVGNSSIAFRGGLFRQDQLLVACELVYVFADPATQTSRSLPLALRETLTAFEAGESMCSVEIGDRPVLGDEADASRQRLFDAPPSALRAERPVPGALQAVVRNRIGQTVATGRLGPGENAVSRLDGVVVHRTLRGNGHGTAVVRALEAAARARDDREVVLDAPTGAERFFLRLGYTVPPGSSANAPGFHPTLHRCLR